MGALRGREHGLAARGKAKGNAMRIVEIQGFCIQLDRQVEFQKWLVENEERLRKSYPPGIEYGGIYVAVFSSEKNACEYYGIDFLDSYAAMDRGAALGKDATSDWVKISEEFLQFLDTDRSAGSSHTLLKSVVDATIMDVPTT
jgi:hypothetical protein